MSRIAVLDKGWVDLEDCFGGDAAVVAGARICYASDADGLGLRDRRLIKRLITSNPAHTTPLEHAVLRFRIKCPLFVRDHLVRHRLASWNIRSLRYCEEEREYYIPGWCGDWKIARCPVDTIGTTGWHVYDAIVDHAVVLDTATEDYIGAMESAFDHYIRLLHQGWPREQARMVLPTAVYTECLLTINCSSFINLLNKRTHKAAQAETRAYADAMFKLWHEVMPITAELWAEHNHYV